MPVSCSRTGSMRGGRSQPGRKEHNEDWPHRQRVWAFLGVQCYRPVRSERLAGGWHRSATNGFRDIDTNNDATAAEYSRAFCCCRDNRYDFLGRIERSTCRFRIRPSADSRRKLQKPGHSQMPKTHGSNRERSSHSGRRRSMSTVGLASARMDRGIADPPQFGA